jgi:deoxyribonuclease IV
MTIRFGTSGNPPNFFKSEFGKDRLNAPNWIKSIGLNAYERMMTYGARMKEEDAIELGKRAKELDIKLSVHGPYYVVLTSTKPDVVEKSINELKKTVYLSNLMGAKKIVLHPGFYAKRKKEEVLKQFIRNIKIVERDSPKEVKILPETMGKHSQFGDLDEVISICERTESEPCIDFGHLHARGLGSLKEKENFRNILIEIEERLGKDVLKNLHCHFYPIEFTDKGEKTHRAVTEKDFAPVFPPFAELIREFKMEPTLISESKDSQDIGALHMRDVMEKLKIN